MRPYSLLVLLVCALGPAASGGDFYQQFLSLIDTNRPTQPLTSFSILVDTNNTGTKATNAVLDLAALKQSGEVARVRLGMTMQEVVDRWGKPRGIWSQCGGGPRFMYMDSDVYFAPSSNCVNAIVISKVPVFENATAAPTMSELIQLLGEPEFHERFADGTIQELIYRSPQGEVVLGCAGWTEPRRLDFISLERSDYAARKRAEFHSFMSRHARTNMAHALDGGIPPLSDQAPPPRRQ